MATSLTLCAPKSTSVQVAGLGVWLAVVGHDRAPCWFAYLAVTHAFAALRLLPLTDREKDVEILALRNQLTVLQRQLGDRRPQL